MRTHIRFDFFKVLRENSACVRARVRAFTLRATLSFANDSGDMRLMMKTIDKDDYPCGGVRVLQDGR